MLGHKDQPVQLDQVTGSSGSTGAMGAAGATGATGLQGERGFGVPQQGNISVPCFAFVPPSSDDSVSYSYNYGLRNTDGSELSYCYAPLQLPQGATITNATFYFYDNDAGFFEFYLMRQNQTLWQIMEEVYNTPGSDTPGVTQISLDDTINGATVDNNNYYYYLLINMPYSSTNEYYYRFYYALVEYAYP